MWITVNKFIKITLLQSSRFFSFFFPTFILFGKSEAAEFSPLGPWQWTTLFSGRLDRRVQSPVEPETEYDRSSSLLHRSRGQQGAYNCDRRADQLQIVVDSLPLFFSTSSHPICLPPFPSSFPSFLFLRSPTQTRAVCDLPLWITYSVINHLMSSRSLLLWERAWIETQWERIMIFRDREKVSCKPK